MDSKSLRLLTLLRENSREKLTSISKRTNIPISTLFDLLRELQQQYITRSTVLLDYSKLGYHTQAQIFLKVQKEERERLKKHLLCHNNINTVHKINNQWDFMIETIHHNIKELDQFLEELEHQFHLENRQIHYLIEELKTAGFKIEN